MMKLTISALSLMLSLSVYANPQCHAIKEQIHAKKAACHSLAKDQRQGCKAEIHQLKAQHQSCKAQAKAAKVKS